ncbi:IS630 family transposase [Marinimicrococcus flavescens]|uniref:IS630 family transposase n=1 Tax=Marinimicrococcus flavescens TaxID=3031815 RepID=A0AAP3XQL4_9PROT|nr:IS630 family transposase [Marinimicrococcus flavescens]
MAWRRARWIRHQVRVDPRRLVFIDARQQRPRGGQDQHDEAARLDPGRRASAGQGAVPQRQNLTFIVALRHDRITAPCVQGGPEGGAAFRAWVEQSLAPTLAPGDILVMDNLSSHKAPGVRAAIRAAKAHLLYLPPYSPELNPIEQVFAKLKHLLRKAEQRTAETVTACIGSLLDSFAPGECANYLTNAGYASIQAHPALRQREGVGAAGRHPDGRSLEGRSRDEDCAAKEILARETRDDAAWKYEPTGHRFDPDGAGRRRCLLPCSG